MLKRGVSAMLLFSCGSALTMRGTLRCSSLRRPLTRLMTTAGWKSFEYGSDPKNLFSSSPPPSSTPLATIVPDLPSSSLQPALDILTPYLTEARLSKLTSVLASRDLNIKFLFENPVNPSNVYACMRTLDSYGVQCVDIISGEMEEEEKENERRRDVARFGRGGSSSRQMKQTNRGARTAAGAAQWVSVDVHDDLTRVAELKAQGYKIFVSTLGGGSVDVREIDFNQGAAEGGNSKICIVMGNEESGVSDAMIALADVTFHIPMCGFAESYNLSVATALTCAYISGGRSVSKVEELDDERKRLMLRWVIQSLPKRGLGEAILRREGILTT